MSFAGSQFHFVHFQWWWTMTTGTPLLYNFVNAIDQNKFADERWESKQNAHFLALLKVKKGNNEFA